MVLLYAASCFMCLFTGPQMMHKHEQIEAITSSQKENKQLLWWGCWSEVCIGLPTFEKETFGMQCFCWVESWTKWCRLSSATSNCGHISWYLSVQLNSTPVLIWVLRYHLAPVLIWVLYGVIQPLFWFQCCDFTQLLFCFEYSDAMQLLF